MKILFMPGYRYPNSLDEPITSGDLRYSFTLSRALARLGHEVDVVTRQGANDSVLSKLDGVSLYRYKSALSKIFGTSFDISWRRYKLFKKLAKEADLIICNTPLSLEQFVKIKTPTVYVASGLEDAKNYSFSPKEIAGFVAIKLLRDPLKRLTWRKSVLVNTTAWLEDKTLEKWGIPRSKIGKISSGVDLTRFSPQLASANAIKKRLGVSEEVILSVSRFTPAKGLIETIKAFEKLDRANTKLVVIGVQHSHNDNYYPKLMEVINKSKNKDHIIVLENISENELPGYYTMASVTSVFSKGYDPLPTVIIESMACGTPVVSTYYKTREQFIDSGESGLFVKEMDIDDWVVKVNQLLDNKSLQERISRNASRNVKDNFDSIKIARKYLRIIGK